MTSAIASNNAAAGVGGAGGPGRGMGSAPGLQPFLEGRIANLRTLLGDNATSPTFVSSDQLSLAFTATAGKAAAPRKLTISAAGSLDPASYTVTASTESGGSWLSVTPASGLTGSQIEVSTTAAKLEAGVYTGTMKLHMATATNSPLLVPVTLTVTR